jgi:hypothetical protein
VSQRPRRDPLPRALRRQSDRPAVARRQPPDALIAQARRGVLTRRNTLPHTKGRQAVDAVVYQSRARRTSPEETVRERLGHAPAPTVTWSEVPTTTGLREITTETRRQSSRVGLYSEDVRLLTYGELDVGDFSAKWRRRKREAAGFELEWDGEKVLALKAAAGPPPEPYYRRHRPMARAA